VVITPVDPLPKLRSTHALKLWLDPLYGWCAQVGPLRFGFFTSRARLAGYLGEAGCAVVQVRSVPAEQADDLGRAALGAG
jgi:hypothetical protein